MTIGIEKHFRFMPNSNECIEFAALAIIITSNRFMLLYFGRTAMRQNKKPQEYELTCGF